MEQEPATPSAEKSPAASPASPHASPAPRPSRRRPRSCCLAIYAIFAMAVLFTVWGPFIVVRGMQKTFGDARFHRMKNLDKTLVTIPAQWLTSDQLVPGNVIAFQKQFYDEVQQLDSRFVSTITPVLSTGTLLGKLQNHVELSAPEKQQLAELVQALQPLVDQTSAALSLPGYTAEMQLYTAAPAPGQVKNFGRYMSAAAWHWAEQGNCARAINWTMLPVHYMKSHEPASLVTHVLELDAMDLATTNLVALAKDCHDPAALQLAVNHLDAMAAKADPPDADQWKLGDSVSQLLRAHAVGYPVDLSPQPYGKFLMQFVRLLNGFNSWAVANLPHDHPMFEAARAGVEKDPAGGENARKQQKVQAVEKLINPVLRFAGGFGIDAYLGEVLAPPAAQVHEQALKVRAHCMNARDQITQQLFSLEKPVAR